MSHKNSKTVTIFRAGSFLSRAQGKELEDFLSTTKRSVGSYWESASSKRVGSGLSFAEEAFLLPNLLDVPAEDREFRKKVTNFYADMDTQVPHGTGRTLEIGLEDSNDKPVAAKNMPINLSDYLRYRQAKGHPQVALTKEDADGNQMKEFYIFDKTDTAKKNDKKREDKDAAIQIYLQIKNDPMKLDAMLTLLGVDPREFTTPGSSPEDILQAKQTELRIQSEKAPAEFTTVYNEADLEIRYWIKTMINTGVFKLMGAKILDGETNKIVANSMEEAVFFFKDEENSESVSMYKARMQEAAKKPLTSRRQQAVAQ